jgi:DNA-binding IclR family transcriptional regulator
VVEEVAVVELMRINSPIGKRMPLYATACGRVLLSALSREERESYYARNQLLPLTGKTLTDIPQLEREILKVQKDGFAYAQENYKTGLLAVAAPISNSQGAVIAAAGIVAPISQFDPDSRVKLAADLKSCAGEISQVLARMS